MTIGYGDLHPTSSVSKMFTVVYIIAGVSMGLLALSSIASQMYENSYEKAYIEARRQIERTGIVHRLKNGVKDELRSGRRIKEKIRRLRIRGFI